MELTLDRYSVPFQEAIVGHMLNQGWFCSASITHIKAGWFTESKLITLFNLLKTFSEEYGRSPTKEEFHAYIRLKNFQGHEALQVKLDTCIASSFNLNRDYVGKEMTGWLRVNLFKNSLMEVIEKFNKNEPNDYVELLNSKVTQMKAISFLQDDAVDFSNPIQFYKDYTGSLDDCMTIGHPDFDELLNSHSKKASPSKLPDNIYGKRNYTLYGKGSLARGDTTMFIGPSNGGKTTAVISVLVANLLSQKHCLLVTHEQNYRDIMNKIYQCFFQKDKLETLEMEKLPDNEKTFLLQLANNILTKYLTYVPWVKAGNMYAEDVVDAIRQKNEFKREERQGPYGFDLVINDYPGKLSLRSASRNMQDHTVKTAVYDMFVSLATEEQFHMICPLQANREGYKKAKHAKEGGAMLSQGDVADAYNIVQRASNVITINASNEDKNAGIVRFLIDKSRSAATGQVFVTKTAYDKSTSISILNASTTYEETRPIAKEFLYNALGVSLASSVADMMNEQDKEVANDLLA